MKNITTHLLLLLILLSSCAGNKYLTSFQDLDKSITSIPLSDHDSLYRVRIQPEDRLAILISSVDPKASELFNLPGQTYLVDSSGDIYLQVLGKLHVEGMTKEGIRNLLLEKLRGYFSEDPIVTVNLINFAIYLSGEVMKPGRMIVDVENISLLQSIINAGDITPGGRKDQVMVIRKTETDNQIFHFDLTQSDILKAQNFYMKQNDIVYVPPTEFKKRDTSESRQFLTVFLPILSTLISAASVLSVILMKR